jgi:hypothetical protein
MGQGVEGDHRGDILQLAAEGLVQQGFFQGVEGCELLLVEGGEALGFILNFFQALNDLTLICQRREWDDYPGKRSLIQALYVCAIATVNHHPAGTTRLQEMAKIGRQNFFGLQSSFYREPRMRSSFTNVANQETAADKFRVAI